MGWAEGTPAVPDKQRGGVLGITWMTALQADSGHSRRLWLLAGLS